MARPKGSGANNMASKIIIALLDNGTMSPSEVSRYLKLKKSSVYTLMPKMRADGIIERAGFGRYSLSDKGRFAAGTILKIKEQKASGEVVETDLPDVTPGLIVNGRLGKKRGSYRKRSVSTVDWQEEFIKLTYYLADTLGKNVDKR